MKIPNNEILCVSYETKKQEVRFIITRDKLQDMFTLYAVKGDKLTKVQKAESPIDLETDNNILEKLKD